MDLGEVDQAPDTGFSETVWKEVNGRDSAIPAPVRSACVRPIAERDGLGARRRNRQVPSQRNRTGLPPESADS